MWHATLGWHAVEFAQTSAILEFYFRFWFRPYHRSRHVILHQSAKFYSNRPADGRKMTLCRFSRWRISAILDFRDPITGSLKSPYTTSYRSSIETVALNSLVVWENRVLHFGDKQMDRPIALSRSRCIIVCEKTQRESQIQSHRTVVRRPCRPQTCRVSDVGYIQSVRAGPRLDQTCRELLLLVVVCCDNQRSGPGHGLVVTGRTADNGVAVGQLRRCT